MNALTRRRRRALRMALACAALAAAIQLVPPPSRAADEGGDAEPPEKTAKPYAVVLENQSPAGVTYLDPLFLSIRLTPLRGIDVKQIEVKPLGQLAALYPAPSGGSWPCRFSANVGARERPFVVTCEVGSGETIGGLLRSPAVLLPPSRQKLVVEVQLRKDLDAVDSYYEEIFVDLGPSKVGVVYGGFFGALLLAVFTSLRRQLESPAVAGPWYTRLGAFAGGLVVHAWRTLAMAIVGGICALVLILLAQVTEGMKPPISIRVQDFWGGVVVGLFSVPLSDWLAKRLREGAPPGGGAAAV